MTLKERDKVVRGVKQLLDEAFEPYEKRIKELEERIDMALDYLPDSPDKAMGYLAPYKGNKCPN